MGELTFEHRWEPQEGATKTLLLLHGTGGNEDDLMPLGRRVAPGTNLLSPRGKVLENGAPRFFRRFAEGKFDEDDIMRQAADLAYFVQSASVDYGFDLATTYGLGYSNGANIASSLLLLHPQVLAGGVLIRAMVPLVPTRPPDLSTKKALICNGRTDPLMPPAETDRLANLLRAAGAKVDVSLAEAGHELTRTDIDAATQWLGSVTP